MPNTSFLEEGSLYRPYHFESIPKFVNLLPKPSIHMFCNICLREQTFNLSNDYYDTCERMRQGSIVTPINTAGNVVYAIYTCASCKKFERNFLIYFSPDLTSVMKVGQYPQWFPTIDKNLQEILGENLQNYKRGLYCEQEGLGIGAFAYYRRILEEKIDGLLDAINEQLTVEDKDKYKNIFKNAKEEHVTEKKIELIKDILPSYLRPSGINPLGRLHTRLSEGLHNKPEEECLEIAEDIRTALVFLLERLNKEDALEYEKAIKRLDSRKAKEV